MRRGREGMNMGYKRAIWAVLVVLTANFSSAQETTSSTPEPPPATESAAPSAPAYQPKFPGDPARSESEALALGYMRTVLRAQKEYKTKKDKYAPSLMALVGGSRSFTRRMASSADRGDYTVGFKPKKDGFELTLTPKELASDRRSFYAEEDGKIHADEEKAADSKSPTVR